MTEETKKKYYLVKATRWVKVEGKMEPLSKTLNLEVDSEGNVKAKEA
jgi:hypothetical protein